MIVFLFYRSEYVNIEPDFSYELFSVIHLVLKENKHTARLISKTLRKNIQWTTSQKACFSDTVYDIIRWWRLLWYILNQEPSFQKQDLHKLLLVYQILFGDQISQNRSFTDEKYAIIKKRFNKAQYSRAVRESVPDWLDAVCEKELGDRWEQELHALNKKPVVAIRTNTIHITKPDLKNMLAKKGIETQNVDIAPEALVLDKKQNVFTLTEFQEGLFEVQDPASQAVSRFLDPKPGMTVVDACAGEGGKTLHIANLMNNKGVVIALDTEPWKLTELKRRVKRAGLNNVETRPITSSKVYKRLNNRCDRLLLDVPCSGLGVLRRKPQIRWNLQPDSLKRLHTLQATLLVKYSPILKLKGRMVYASCSILPSEGEQQIKQFLTNQAEKYRLLEEKRFSPSTDGFDGFYMALLERIL